MSSRRLSAALLVSLAAAAPSAFAQAIPETPLARPLAKYSGEFSLIRGIRELANGSVLVADPINSVLTRLDPALVRMDTLGRNGRGPGEYIQPDGIWPLPGDSSLLVDLGNNRLTVVSPAGKLGKTQSIIGAGGGGGDGPPPLMLIEATDRNGTMWFAGQPDGDSLPIFKVDRRTGAVSRVMQIKGPPVKREESGSDNARSVSISDIPMGAHDGWAVASTGALFVVRSADYHVDVMAPTGARTSGAAVPHGSVSIGEAEKKEWADETARNGGINVNVNDNGSGPVFQISRARSNGDRLRNLPWPAAKSPFYADQMYVDSRDRLWVRRSEKAGRPAVYDVFDLTGKRVGAVRFTANRTIVGFGAKGMYVAAIDDNDLQFLERYALPL